jgi:eukaryotic-like serine/threonine-protein kinase
LDDSMSSIPVSSAAGLLAEGSRFGAYVIGPCIGHGGMARIYRAEHEGLMRQVALKVLTQGMEPGTEGRARFLREARIAAAIKHPNVVNIFDIGVESGIPYLVMELLVGQDLETLLSSHGALSEHTIIDIIIPVVAGLVAVHDAGVVHRDLKPANIFLSKGPNDEVEPKLLDFGISKAAGVDKMRLTSTRGLLMGTPLYMSPEAMLGKDMTPASDQYSLGVVLYECATGVNPFMADTVAETARRVTSGQFAPMSEQAIRPSRRLQAIIERAMSLEPHQRFRDMRAFGQELLQLAGQRTRITWGLTFGEVAAAARAQHAREVDEEAIALARTRAPRRSSRGVIWPWVAAGCVVLATVAAVFVVATGRDHGPEAAPAAAAPPALAGVPSAGRDDSSSSLLPASTVERVVAPPVMDGRELVAPRMVERTAMKPSEPVEEGEPNPEEAAGSETPPDDERANVRVREPRVRFRPRPRPRPEPAEPPPVLPQTPEWIIDRGAESPQEASATEPDAPPEWLIERSPPRARATQSPVQMGTNDAPIFD